MNKTKMILVTFSNKERELAATVVTTIRGKPVEIVDESKYQGSVFNNLLNFSSNAEKILRKYYQQQ